MLQQLQAIARNTFVESIRQPIYAVIVLGAAVVLVLLPMITANTLSDDNKQLVELGLGTLALAGLLLSAFTATGVLNREIENQTVLTVVSKPVARATFVLGKYLGVAGALTLAYWTLTCIFLLTVRHKVMMTASDPFDMPVIVLGVSAGLLAIVGSTLANYYYRKVFTSTLALSLAGLLTGALVLVFFIAKGWRFQWPSAEFADDGALMRGQVAVALLLVLEVLLLLTAVAVAVSTRLGQVMTLVACTLVFVLGLVSGAVFGQSWPDAAGGNTLAWLLYHLVPNIHFLWTADAITSDLDLTWRYVLSVSAYAALFILAVLSLAIGLFQTREVG